MKVICLFDIDGTLLNSGGAGQRAMERALGEVCGIHEIRCDIPAAGRTDRAITADLFRVHDVKETPELQARFLEAYLRNLPLALNELEGCVLPGIGELIETLAAAEEVVLGLLTGNYRAGATLKLRHYQLDQHFAFGGFGDHHHDRNDVAKAALKEAQQLLGQDIPGNQVFVIGDTPADVRCARAIQARAIAVATGIYGYKQLQASRPDRLFSDFSNPEDFLEEIFE